MKEKIKRISSSTWALILALMMVVSSFSVLAATTNVNKSGDSESMNSDDTIYLKPSTDWLNSVSKFGIYVWKSNNDSRWVLMNDDDGDGYYSATVPSGGPYAKIIFLGFNNVTATPDTGWPNDVAKQTKDLTKDVGKNCFTITGTGDRPGGIWSTYTPAKQGVADSVSLSLKNATDGKIDYRTDLSVTATLTHKNSSVGTVDYNFYLDNSTSPLKTISSTDETCNYTIPASKLTPGNHTVKVEASADGYGSVSATQTVTVFSVAGYTITKPTTTDFTVTVDGDLAEASLGTEVSFTVAKAHEYAVLDKVTVTDDSGKQVPLNQKGDKYTFTMPASNVTINVVSSTSSTGYGLVGDFNTWNTGANVFVKNSSSTSDYSYTTVDLTAGTYEFKVANGDSWYTKAGTTITSSSCTDIQFSINSSESANCKITVTEAGTYKFVWNTSTKKISVIYPNAKYYVVGRFMTSTYETSNWNTTDKNMPFTYDSETGYYKLETGKTIKDLSGVQTKTSPNAYYYFWLYDGGSYYQPSTLNTKFHNNDSSNKQNLVYTSTDKSQRLRFSDTSSTNTSPVTLWYDPVERQIWYEAISTVASVTLTAEEKDYYYGDSVNLTANVTNAKLDNLTYTFTEVDENGSEVGTPVTSNTNTVTFNNLTDGKHYYKVEVSAEGYKSVTATTSITVKKHNIATSVVASTTFSEVTYGNDVQVTAVLNDKYKGYTGNVTCTLLDENGNAVSGVDSIITPNTNVSFTVKKPSTGEHIYKVAVSAENYETVESNTVSVYVKRTPITSEVTFLSGPVSGYDYKVGDSIKLKASCEDAPEGVTVKYNYYINGNKINGSATPNTVTYNFTASDVGTITFYAEAVADNYDTVKSDEISASVIMKLVATSVNLTATPTDVKVGNEVTITAKLQGDIQSGNFTYTFKETAANGDIKVIKSVQSDYGSATIFTRDLSVGTHKISVEVSGTNFKSITSTEELVVTVSEAYHNVDVNKTSGKTLLVSYDTDTSNTRTYSHIWSTSVGLADGGKESGAMTTVTSITGLYYKDVTSAAKDNNLTSGTQLGFIVMPSMNDWNNKYEVSPSDNSFKVGTQWYVTRINNSNKNSEYTPLTFTKLSVPTEINDVDSTQFVFTVGGGLPNFFKNVVQSTTIKPEYTVTITAPNGEVVGKASSNDTEITLDKLTLLDDGKYTFTVTDGIDTVSYTKDLKITHLDVNNYNATVNASDNAKITVTCKDTTITGGSTGELPERRNAIISVTDIKEGYKVRSVSVKSGVNDIPYTSLGNNQYLFKMPSSDVTITVDVVEKSKYVVNFGVSDKTNGSITASAGSTSINTGERIAEDTKVKFTVKTSSGYAVDGWYSDASYRNKIDGVKNDATTYTTTISKTTDVYVKISDDAGTLTNYRLYYGKNNVTDPSKWTDYVPVYKKANGKLVASIPDSLFVEKHKHYFALFKGDKSENNMQWNNQGYTVERKSSNTEYVTVDPQNNYEGYNNFAAFYFLKVDGLLGLNIVMADPSVSPTVGSYVVTPIVKTAPEGALEVYAKDGTLLTTSGYGDTTVSGMNADCEGFENDKGTYKQYAAMPGDRLTITTVVNDAQAEQGWYVSNYVINGVGYDAISTVIAQAAVQAGSTGASYTISTPYSVTGEETNNIIEITPIYKNRKIEAANDYITLYANADSLGNAWGNTISVYSYYYKEGKQNKYTDKAMNSAYPGEPMMKTSGGLYVAYVPKNAWGVENGEFKKLSNYSVSGITFNNYMEDEKVHQKVLTTAQSSNFQTYDYDDFKLIADAGYDTVLYDFKYRNGTTNQSTLVNNSKTYATLNPPDTIDPSVYADAKHNGWEVLTNMDNEEVSLLGYSARNASTISKTFDNKNRLHIVSVGNISTTMGKWSTVWFVYDKYNKLVTYGIPSDFIPRLNSDGSESTEQTDAYKAIKNKQLEYTGAYICYESEQNKDTSIETSNTGVRSDGRWYYSRAVDQVKVNTHVLYAGEDKTNWKEDTYSSDYAGVTTGAKALVGTERTTKVDRNSEVGITASALGTVTDPVQYKFIGWTTDVTKDSDGNLTVKENPSMTDSAQTIKVSTNMDLYALYIPVAKGDLIITHEKFTGEKAYGGPGRYFVQATLYKKDNVTVKATYYQEGSVTIPNYTEKSGKIDVQLIVYSVNGSRYKATYNYKFDAITDGSHVDKVCSSGDSAVVERTINASDVFDGSNMKTSKIDFYSDLQTNNITVKMNYYNRKVENGKPADMDSTPTSYSYRFTSYPSDVLNTDGTLSIPKLIEYAKNNSQQPDNMIEKYISWNSQDDALKGIVKYTNYHTKTNDKYEATPYHTDQYGKVQKTGEKWVTYYDRNGVEVDEEDAKAETVSSISIWYFNTPKKYTYTLKTANSSSELGDNEDGTFYGTTTETASELFYNTRLFTSDREVSDATSPYTEAYGVEHGFTGQAINTAETINNNGTALKFLYWAYDTAGKKIASTNIQYGLRITNNTTLYAIYGKTKITAPGLTVQEVTPDTFFDSNNISKTRINTIFNPYNCKDNDENIVSASVVYLRVSNATTEKSLNNLNYDDLQTLRTQISTVVSKASYEKFKSGDVDDKTSQDILQISGSTASGFKFKIVKDPSSSSTELQTSLSNKNRGQFTTTFTTSTLKNYTYYVFATMGYKNYNVTGESVVKDSDGIAYITSDNFAKYYFDKDGKYVASSNS